MFKKNTHKIKFLVRFLLIIPIHAAEFDHKGDEIIEQANALLVNTPDQPLLLTSQRARRQKICNSNYVMGGLEVMAGAGIVIKGIGFAVLENNQSATEKSFILLPDMFLGILLIVDGICRLLPRKIIR